VPVPGLPQQLVYAFNNSNLKAYRTRALLHAPFAIIPSGMNEPEHHTLTAAELTDVLTSVTTFTKSTSNKEKLFKLIFSNCTNDNGETCVVPGCCPDSNGNCPSGCYPESGGCCTSKNSGIGPE